MTNTNTAKREALAEADPAVTSDARDAQLTPDQQTRQSALTLARTAEGWPRDRQPLPCPIHDTAGVGMAKNRPAFPPNLARGGRSGPGPYCGTPEPATAKFGALCGVRTDAR